MRTIAMGGANIFLRALHGWCAASAGEDEEARAILRELHGLERQEYVWATGVALIYANLGEMDRAFDYLERAYQDRAGWLNVLGISPAFDPFRADPRFDSIVKRVGVVVVPEVARQKFSLVRARRAADASSSESRKSIAVLPFANLSPDPENEFFADGITDDLIAQVAKIGSLRVIARTSVMRYRGTQMPAVQAARELGVSAVVEGTVRRAGKRARVVAQLVDAATDAPIWSETFDRDLEDIFSVQTEVAMNVAQALKTSLSPADERRLAKPATRDATAYDLYLTGRHHYNRRTPDSLAAAIKHFELAIARDPAYVAARAGLADAWIFAGLGYAPISPTEAFAKARQAADQALALDETSPEAHCAMGLGSMHGDWDAAAASRWFRRAIASNPNHAPAHQFLAWCLCAEGDYMTALEPQRHALELDPLNVSVVTECGWPFTYAGLHEIALRHYQRAIELDPGFGLAHYNVGLALQGLGRPTEARAAYRRAIDRMGKTPWVMTSLATASNEQGECDAAEAILAELHVMASPGIAVWLSIAMVLDSLGRVDEAFDALERSLAEHEPFVWAIGIEGWLKFPHARRLPRFQAILDRVGARAHDVPRQRELLLQAHAGHALPRR